VPVDISGDYLEHSAAELQQRFPKLEVLPIVADFARPFTLPGGLGHLPKLGFFPGSTIGNFVPWSATDLLRQFRALLGPGAQLLIGMDRVKPVERLMSAYDEPEGVTAEFNLNLLARINRELGGDFDLRAFRHEAVWNDADSRIEMHLVSRKAQKVTIGSRTFSFAEGERIHTENSCKYDLAAFGRLAGDAGWRVARVWTDPRSWFSLQELETA
jgi:L-histidine Nalpha-methyltransferase